MGTMQVQVEPTEVPDQLAAPRLEGPPPGAFGEGLAVGLHQLGQGITAFGMEYERELLKKKQKTDAAAAMNAYSAIGDWEQKNISDPEVRDAQGNVTAAGGALAARGQQASGITKATLGEFNEFGKKLLQSAQNAEQKQAILHHLIAARNGIANNVGAHERREFDQYVRKSAAGAVGTAVNEGVNASINWPPIDPGAAPFPAAVLSAYEKGASAVETVASIDGMSEEERVLELQKYNTRFWTTIQEQQQRLGNTAVVELIDQQFRKPRKMTLNGQSIDYAGMDEATLVQTKYDDRLQALGANKRAQNIVNKIDPNLDFGEQIAIALNEQAQDPVMGAMAVHKVTERYTLLKKAHNEDQEKHLNVIAGEFAKRIVNGTLPLTPTDLPEWPKLDGKYRVQFATKSMRMTTALGGKQQAAIDAKALGAWYQHTIDNPEASKRLNIRATYPEASEGMLARITGQKAGLVKGTQLGFGTTIGEVRTKLNSIQALQGEDKKDARAVIVGHVMDWYEKQEAKPDQVKVNAMIDALVAPHIKKPNIAAAIINGIFGTEFGTTGPGYKVILQGGALTPTQAAGFGIDQAGNIAKPTPAPAAAKPAAAPAAATETFAPLPKKGLKTGSFYISDWRMENGYQISADEAKDPVAALKKRNLDPKKYRVLGARR